MKIGGLLLTVSFFVIAFGGNSSQAAEDSPPTAADAKTDEVPCHCAGEDTPAMARITRILGEPLKSSGLSFNQTPFENVVNFLQDEYNIPMQIDEPALEDAGLTTDEPITVQLSNISLRSALRLLLKTKQLTYILRNEVMIITTPEEAECELVTCVYDVRDLLNSMGGEREIKNLANVIVTCIASETWATNKRGVAQIRTLRPGLLVISQTQAVQREVAELLAAIRATLSRTAPMQAGRDMGMMGGGRGGYGMSGEGMGGFGGGRGGYGGRGGMEGRADDMFEGGYGEVGGEMGREPTPVDADPFAR
jgi:hypothetical protein